jgi:hypothetical protein
VIYSPDVPVFRSDDGDLLEKPYNVSIITSPAVYAERVQLERRNEILPAMWSRILKVLSVGLLHGHDSIVLGAWGCGAFGNDPLEIAKLFHRALEENFRRLRASRFRHHRLVARTKIYSSVSKCFPLGRLKIRNSAMDTKERFNGCLLGLAVGDAVGTTLEFKPPGSFKPISGMAGGGPFRLKPGEWTDDTSMALCLATSLLGKNGSDPKDQMDRYCRWWKEGYLSSNGRCFEILKAANLGDDADTTAAICGQVAGAFYGESGIPGKWLDRLAMRKEIKELVDRLCANR